MPDVATPTPQVPTLSPTPYPAPKRATALSRIDNSYTHPYHFVYLLYSQKELRHACCCHQSTRSA